MDDTLVRQTVREREKERVNEVNRLNWKEMELVKSSHL